MDFFKEVGTKKTLVFAIVFVGKKYKYSVSKKTIKKEDI